MAVIVDETLVASNECKRYMERTDATAAGEVMLAVRTEWQHPSWTVRGTHQGFISYMYQDHVYKPKNWTCVQDLTLHVTVACGSVFGDHEGVSLTTVPICNDAVFSEVSDFHTGSIPKEQLTLCPRL